MNKVAIICKWGIYRSVVTLDVSDNTVTQEDQKRAQKAFADRIKEMWPTDGLLQTIDPDSVVVDEIYLIEV